MANQHQQLNRSLQSFPPRWNRKTRIRVWWYWKTISLRRKVRLLKARIPSLRLPISINLSGLSFPRLPVWRVDLREPVTRMISMLGGICVRIVLAPLLLLMKVFEQSPGRLEQVELTRNIETPEKYPTLPYHITMWTRRTGPGRFNIFRRK